MSTLKGASSILFCDDSSHHLLIYSAGIGIGSVCCYEMALTDVAYNVKCGQLELKLFSFALSFSHIGNLFLRT